MTLAGLYRPGMDTSGAGRDRQRDGDGRTTFEKFVEATYALVSRAPFFVAMLAVVAVWLVSYPLFSSAKSWQVVIHTVASVVTLLLLTLLENASRRGEEAAQEKLNVLAEALAALMESAGKDDPELQQATRRLRDAVGLEERH
jgi:low affinity Fe/Cu permease